MTPAAKQAGMTLLELIIVCAILLILASAAMPVARFTVKRQKEAELRRELREMRDAIDRYKDAADKNQIRVALGSEGYPADLDTLVKGVDVVAQANGAIPGATAAAAISTAIGSGLGLSINTSPNALSGTGTPPSTSGGLGGVGQDLIRHVRYLRRIPVDPMTGKAEWGMRSVQDDPDSSSWGGKNVFDVFSLSDGTALDGSKYSTW